MSLLTAAKSGSGFDRALTSVEALALDEQEVLLEVVRRRIAAARRAALARDVAATRRDYRSGKVRRGTAAELSAELRRARSWSGVHASPAPSGGLAAAKRRSWRMWNQPSASWRAIRFILRSARTN